MATESLSKQGISPLIATVLLVAFSVGLGAIVMSWGEQYVEQKADFVQGVKEAVTACDEATFTILQLGETQQICYKESTIETTLDNGPEVDIYDFSARIISAGGTYTAETTIKDTLKKLHAAKIIIPYPKVIGPPKQVKIVPKIKSGNDIILCKNKNVVAENIQAC